MFSSKDVLESHTFPVFMGTGTVSRRLDDVRFAPSISSSSPRPLVWKPAWFISSCRRRTTQESDLAVNSRPPSLEVSTSFAHSVALSFLSCQKSVNPVTEADSDKTPPKPPSPTRPPRPKKKKGNGPFSEHFSDKQRLLVRLSSHSERSRLRGVAYRRVLKFKLSGQEGKWRIRAKQPRNPRF